MSSTRRDSGWPLLVLILLLFLLVPPGARAHVVQSIFTRFDAGPGGWKAEVTLDAGYAWPLSRDDAAAPQPTLEWLQAKSPREFNILRQESEQLLRHHLQFSSGGRSLEWTCRFPDFDSFPPDFPRLPGGFAYLTVVLNGTEIPVPEEPINVRELSGKGPFFTFALGADYETLEPGGTLQLTQGQHPNSSALVHFLKEGFLHVLPLGWDHLLFITAMFLLDRRFRPVMLQSLLFTAAHTLTLGLVLSGHLSPVPRVVEPLIALSIAAVAIENVFASRMRPFRLFLIFAFGLVHGMGFGGALASVLQGTGNVVPLLAVNLGVEAAQVTWLCAAALCMRLVPKGNPREKTAKVLSILIAAAGLAVFAWRLASG